MPETKEQASDPHDVQGIPWEEGGELQGSGDVDVAKALGVKPEEEETPTEPATGDEPTGEEETEKRPEGEKPKGADLDAKSKEVLENYEATLQSTSEELYATTLYRVKSERQEVLDALVQSDNPVEQKLAKKIIERNDFGAKSVEDYRKNLVKKSAGDNPTDQKLAELEMEIKELKQGDQTKAWDQLKKDNAVTGKAEEIADDIHARFPDMEFGEVMATVKGKMGNEYREPIKPSAYAGGHGDTSGGEYDPMSSPLAKKLLPNWKDTKKFGKQLAAQ